MSERTVLTRSGLTLHFPRKAGSNMTKCGRWIVDYPTPDYEKLCYDRNLICGNCTRVAQHLTTPGADKEDEG